MRGPRRRSCSPGDTDKAARHRASHVIGHTQRLQGVDHRKQGLPEVKVRDHRTRVAAAAPPPCGHPPRRRRARAEGSRRAPPHWRPDAHGVPPRERTAGRNSSARSSAGAEMPVPASGSRRARSVRPPEGYPAKAASSFLSPRLQDTASRERNGGTWARSGSGRGRKSGGSFRIVSDAASRTRGQCRSRSDTVPRRQRQCRKRSDTAPRAQGKCRTRFDTAPGRQGQCQKRFDAAPGLFRGFRGRSDPVGKLLKASPADKE